MLFDPLALGDVERSAGKNRTPAGAVDPSSTIVNPVILTIWPAQTEFVFPLFTGLNELLDSSLYAGAIFRMDLVEPLTEGLIRCKFRVMAVLVLQWACYPSALKVNLPRPRRFDCAVLLQNAFDAAWITRSLSSISSFSW